MQETHEIRALSPHLRHATHHHAHVLGLLVATASSYVLHSHEYLIYPCNILLHLGNIVLQHSHLDSLGTPESLHDGAVLVPDVLLDDAL